MASGFWHRIEPNTRSPDLDVALQAPLADPLWLLARQWQVGELRGEDAASPVRARIQGESHPLSSLANAGGDKVSLARDQPLEPEVECEPVSDGPAAFGVAAQAGVQLARRLSSAGLDGAIATLHASYALAAPTVELALPPREARRVKLLAARALDGAKLAASTDDEITKLLPAPQRAAASKALAAWRAEIGNRFREPNAGGCWVDEQLHYSFSVAAATDEGEVVLAADHPGGALDWRAFDVDESATHGLAASAERAERHPRTVLPAPVSYAGMPASRFWELEDGAVYFGAVEAGPADLGRLVVLEFATVYSDDWFLIPMRARAGTINRVTRLEVLDSFGGHISIASLAANDQASLGDNRPWRIFEMDGDGAAAAGEAPWLLVPPAGGRVLDGAPIESVRFVRDERANLAWGVEALVEAPTGRTIARRAAVEETPPTSEDTWRYRAFPEVPGHVIPFSPERTSDGVSVKLRRARVAGWSSLPREEVGPKGRVLAPERALRIAEEEVPTSGVAVTRNWRLARASDGTLRLWVGRRKRLRDTEAGTGAAADRIDRRENASVDG